MVDLKNKNILITGATSGIGKSCAYLFAKFGSNLIITARREEKLKKISEDLISKYNIKCCYYKVDVRNRIEATRKAQSI